MIEIDYYENEHFDICTMQHFINAAKFYMTELMPRVRNINIIIDVQKKLDDNAKGYCAQEASREFTIELKVDLLHNMIITLAHEMVHVRQFIRKQEINEFEAYGLEKLLYDRFHKYNAK